MGKVKPGMSAKEIAVLHYELLTEGNQEEWLKTVKKNSISRARRYWWETGRQRIDAGMSFSFKNEDTIVKRTETMVKFFFNRIGKDGKPSGSGQVPITVVKDPEDNNEWRVDVGSY